MPSRSPPRTISSYHRRKAASASKRRKTLAARSPSAVAATRAKRSAAMKARWASPSGRRALSGSRSPMSASARKRRSEAQKARWAGVSASKRKAWGAAIGSGRHVAAVGRAYDSCVSKCSSARAARLSGEYVRKPPSKVSSKQRAARNRMKAVGPFRAIAAAQVAGMTASQVSRLAATKQGAIGKLAFQLAREAGAI